MYTSQHWGRLPHALAWVVWTGVFSVLMLPGSHAQEFDFTPSGAAPPPLTEPGTLPPDSGLAPAPLPSSSEVPPQAYEVPAPGEAVPVMPILPQAQSSGELPTVALPADPIPVAPSTTAAAPAATSYTRQPGITPGIPVGGTSPGKLLEGTTIPLTVYREFTFQPYQAINSNLEVSDPVTDDRGNVVIPAGSTVWGSFVPVIEQEEVENSRGDTQLEDKLLGNRFVANRLTIGSATYLLQGNSEILPTSLDPNADLGTVALRGAGYGALGGLALGVLTGGLAAPLLAGSVAGAAAGSTNVDQVVTLAPNTVIPVTLTGDLILR